MNDEYKVKGKDKIARTLIEWEDLISKGTRLARFKTGENVKTTIAESGRDEFQHYGLITDNMMQNIIQSIPYIKENPPPRHKSQYEEQEELIRKGMGAFAVRATRKAWETASGRGSPEEREEYFLEVFSNSLREFANSLTRSSSIKSPTRKIYPKKVGEMLLKFIEDHSRLPDTIQELKEYNIENLNDGSLRKGITWYLLDSHMIGSK